MTAMACGKTCGTGRHIVLTSKTKPYNGQKPGTSGLRKAVTVFQQTNYTENFVQSILSTLPSSGDVSQLKGSTLVVGGDGRYFCKEAAQLIIQMCAGNGISKVIVGRDALFSTPAVSVVIRKYKLTGGIILTASHNPGGPDHDFGIKFNGSNGGPASDETTNRIFEWSQHVTEYHSVPCLSVDLSVLGTHTFSIQESEFTVEVVDPVIDYADLMRELFDFDAIFCFLAEEKRKAPFRVLIDSMNGVTGPYVERIFVHMLGAPCNNVINVVPLEDFGGKHPDPNLTYAKDLLTAMEYGDYDLGAAFDGDGDRNMILGSKGFFVNPSDSLAVLADNLEFIPYYKNKITGYARSMPTSAAVDRVARAKNKEVYETPTGWKYFGNLMDADKITLCGEESFGTGSNHIREKDGIWAVLAWLSIICYKGSSVEALLKEHWEKYGRNYFTRYDYENCDSDECKKMLDKFENLIMSEDYIGREYISGEKTYKVKQSDNFNYTDPIDGSSATKQGYRVLFDDGSRFVVRLSGTGSSGATVRLYVEQYEPDPQKVLENAQVVLSPLVQIALDILRLEHYTGRTEPTVIT